MECGRVRMGWGIMLREGRRERTAVLGSTRPRTRQSGSDGCARYAQREREGEREGESAVASLAADLVEL